MRAQPCLIWKRRDDGFSFWFRLSRRVWSEKGRAASKNEPHHQCCKVRFSFVLGTLVNAASRWRHNPWTKPEPQLDWSISFLSLLAFYKDKTRPLTMKLGHFWHSARLARKCRPAQNYWGPFVYNIFDHRPHWNLSEWLANYDFFLLGSGTPMSSQRPEQTRLNDWTAVALCRPVELSIACYTNLMVFCVMSFCSDFNQR